MKVLVAEDDRVTRLTLQKQLTKWGYEVIACEDGDSAWHILKQEDAPKLLLLDWVMPGRTGLDLCIELNKLPEKSDYYALMLTGRNAKQDLIRALEAGADDYLVKPFNTQELQVRLRAGKRIIQGRNSLKNKHQELQHVNQHLEELVIERTQKLKEALEVAKHASEMKSHFLANMSHEIRTPLNGIVSYVEVLLLSDIDEEQREDLFTIRNCVHSLKKIIDEVLDFSKIEAGKMVIDNSEFSLRRAVYEITSILEHNIEENQQTLIVNIEDSVPDEIISDRVRIQQIITNFLGNALKFGHNHGGIVLHVKPLSLTEDTCQLFIGVADSGVGIPENKQNIIFDSFSQADVSTTRNFGGTGLGLAICKRLAELMGGEIHVESEVDVGSLFWVEIPVSLPTSPHKIKTVDSLQPINVSSEKNGESNIKILLAEDNVVNQKAMKRALTAYGFNVTTVETGIAVLEELQKQAFQLVLMDIQMPIMGGEEATKKIRGGDEPFAGIPIVALTANTSKDDEEKYIRSGMNEFVSKPIDYDRLVHVIHSLCHTTE